MLDGGGVFLNLTQLLDRLRHTDFMENVTHWETIPARAAQYAPFPEGLDARIPPVLRARGIGQLYTHQRKALEEVLAGKNICVVTPTAS